MPSQFMIGIDLGTTNSVMAFADLSRDDPPTLELLSIPQLTAPGTIDRREQLPSFLYLPPDAERKNASFDLPWETGRDDVVGVWARDQSATAAERTVGAAKSWLTHSGVDRLAEILPWDAPPEVDKVSPFTATQRYLAHLVAAWNDAHPDAPIAQQQVVLTVPASFDASARNLTREAAVAAGLPPHFLLLEEPQAAVYAWLAHQQEGWRSEVAVDDRILVCDIGGGTTDLTLVGVSQSAGTLELERLAVGKHLLVGGDNMDLALAYHASQRFEEQGVELDAWQAVSLWHACRQAKEALLQSARKESHPVTVRRRGRRLIGGTLTVDLLRADVQSLLVDGFLPPCQLSDQPTSNRQSGFIQLGLPFETDTAITRHLASFLTANANDQDGSATRPSHVLFNGGVLRAPALRERLMEVLGQWFPDRPPVELSGQRDLDYAVARGAAYYGWCKQRGGVRIRGGTARSYYVGLETAGLAIPGAPRPLKALCVVPFGMEEGTSIDVPASETGLVLGQPVQFRFFSSLVRKQDQAGELLPSIDPDQLDETDSLETELPAAPGGEPSNQYVPVQLQSRVTELGVLELWCVSTQGDERWKLEFNVRG